MKRHRSLGGWRLGLAAGVCVVVAAGTLAFTPAGRQLLPDMDQHVNSAPQEDAPAQATPEPDPYLTRAQFAKLLADSFSLPDAWTNPFTDVASDNWARGAIDAVVQAGWMKPYAGERFAPKQHVSAGETLDGVLKALQIPGDLREAKLPASVEPADSEAFGVDVAQLIGLVPADQSFERNRPVTRAAVDSLLSAAHKLDRVTGTVVSYDQENATITLRDDSGKTQAVALSQNVPLVRNTVPASPDTLLAGDSLFALTDAQGKALLIAARGKITDDDLAGKLADLTSGVLKPDLLKAVMDGDWQSAQNDLSGIAYDKLVAAGATAEEAEAAVNQNWPHLRDLLETRGAHLLGTQMGIEPSLINSLLQQDWSAARDQAVTDIAQQLLGHYMSDSSGTNQALGLS